MQTTQNASSVAQGVSHTTVSARKGNNKMLTVQKTSQPRKYTKYQSNYYLKPSTTGNCPYTIEQISDRLGYALRDYHTALSQGELRKKTQADTWNKVAKIFYFARNWWGIETAVELWTNGEKRFRLPRITPGVRPDYVQDQRTELAHTTQFIPELTPQYIRDTWLDPFHDEVEEKEIVLETQRVEVVGEDLYIANGQEVHTPIYGTTQEVTGGTRIRNRAQVAYAGTDGLEALQSWYYEGDRMYAGMPTEEQIREDIISGIEMLKASYALVLRENDRPILDYAHGSPAHDTFQRDIVYVEGRFSPRVAKGMVEYARGVRGFDLEEAVEITVKTYFSRFNEMFPAVEKPLVATRRKGYGVALEAADIPTTRKAGEASSIHRDTRLGLRADRFAVKRQDDRTGIERALDCSFTTFCAIFRSRPTFSIYETGARATGRALRITVDTLESVLSRPENTQEQYLKILMLAKWADEEATWNQEPASYLKYATAVTGKFYGYDNARHLAGLVETAAHQAPKKGDSFLIETHRKSQ